MGRHRYLLGEDDIPDRWYNIAADLPSMPPADRDALVLRAEGISVFVVNGDNTANQVAVTPGIGQGEDIEVSGDLEPGDRVVVRGNERLQPGQEVAIQDS